MNQLLIEIYSYAKDPYEAKYQLLINKRENTGVKYLNDPKAFIECSNDMDNIYENIEEYNPNKKRKVLIVFDDMIADMLSNKRPNPIVAELFTSYFAFPKNIRLNLRHYFVMKRLN